MLKFILCFKMSYREISLVWGALIFLDFVGQLNLEFRCKWTDNSTTCILYNGPYQNPHIYISTDNFVLGKSLNFMHMKVTNSTVSFYVVYLDCFLSPSDCQCTSGRNSLEHGLYRWVIVNKAFATYSYGHWSDYRDIVLIKFE